MLENVDGGTFSKAQYATLFYFYPYRRRSKPLIVTKDYTNTNSKF